MNITEWIGFATLIVTIITSIFLPFIQRPAINYQVYNETQNGIAANRYKIEILNYGFMTAHNVVVSLRYSDGNLKSLVSEPYLSTGYTKDNATGSNDTAFAKVGVLPPFGSVALHVEFDGPLQPANEMLKSVYVSSDEAVGRETPMTILVNMVIASFVIGASISVYLVWKKFFYPHGVQALSRRGHRNSTRPWLIRLFHLKWRSR